MKYQTYKTIRQHLNELPVYVSGKALSYTNKENLEIIATSLNDALRRAFVWQDTREGFEYWEQFMNIK